MFFFGYPILSLYWVCSLFRNDKCLIVVGTVLFLLCFISLPIRDRELILSGESVRPSAYAFLQYLRSHGIIVVLLSLHITYVHSVRVGGGRSRTFLRPTPTDKTIYFVHC